MMFGLTSYGQDYFNKIIPFDFANPNAGQLLMAEEKFLIPVIYAGAQSTIINYKLPLDIDYHHVNNFDFASTALSYHNGSMYAFAKDREKDKALKLAKFNTDFDMIWESGINTKGDSNFPDGSIILGNAIYSSFSYEEGIGDPMMGLSKTSLTGEVEWVKYYFEEDDFSLPWNMIPTRDGNMLISYVFQYEDDRNNRQPFVMKVDTDGNIIWNAGPFDDLDYSNIKVAELSNGQVLVSYDKDKWLDYDVLCCYDPYTPALLWLDESGQLLKEELYLIELYNEVSIRGLTAGKGDYFYSYGTYTVDPPGPNPEGDNYFAYITKHNNDGDTLWSKRYRHPEYIGPSISYAIEEIVELDNGDIVAQGEINVSGENEIWLLKVDSNGCLDPDHCDGEVLISSTIESDLNSTRQKITASPNPTTGLITLDGIESHNVMEITVYNTTGEMVYTADDMTGQLDLSDLITGIYLIHIHYRDGSVEIEQLVVDR